ncbi:hypothetical protein [Paludisphaera mucosa]|uniref:Twin-arginine translocation signal domain-containing protein n=1 Tax=Paludisphaera mucosa TaxID=3030827 RepID=A0ABT6F6V3_9BACT|nr:hypothetical protein [Paludisphaera mucosa]MDG3003305.1 hypothetical protein [Paludisphaera mucosa]
MDRGYPRRDFLRSASIAGAGLAGWERIQGRAGAAEEAKIRPEMVRLRPEIEPVVRWIEETPREGVFEKAVAELKAGLSYRSLLGSLFLAGVRNIQPRPVGFKFHAVLVMNSAHFLGQSSPASERLLPLFWALDNFKSSQAKDVAEGDWSLGAVDEARVPRPHRAKEDFVRAMEAWDVDGADVAIAGLCRGSGAAETMEPLWRMAVRDQRDIGHKAIFAAQSWRTLQAIGWEHAEPVLRCLAYGLLDLGGSKPGPVGPYEENLRNAAKIGPDWQAGRPDPAATVALLAMLREATPEAASAEVVKLLGQGVAPGSIWDAALLFSSELMMRNPGIIAIHATTSANALHFIFGASGDDTTRKLALLQAIGWQPLYRERIKSPNPVVIDAMPDDAAISTEPASIERIFDAVGQDKAKAASETLAYLSRGGSADALFQVASRMIMHKGTDSHDYKYSAAVWEESLNTTDPKWRPRLAAAAMYNLPGTQRPNSPLMKRAREAVASVMG